jgi:hypothetical protein
MPTANVFVTARRPPAPSGVQPSPQPYRDGPAQHSSTALSGHNDWRPIRASGRNRPDRLAAQRNMMELGVESDILPSEWLPVPVQ